MSFFFSSNPSQVVILNVILIIQDSNVSEIILKMFNFEQYEPINTKWSIAKYFYSPVVTITPPNLQKVRKSWKKEIKNGKAKSYIPKSLSTKKIYFD